MVFQGAAAPSPQEYPLGNSDRTAFAPRASFPLVAHSGHTPRSLRNLPLECCPWATDASISGLANRFVRSTRRTTCSGRGWHCYIFTNNGGYLCVAFCGRRLDAWL